jgi:hypothetical protein
MYVHIHFWIWIKERSMKENFTTVSRSIHYRKSFNWLFSCSNLIVLHKQHPYLKTKSHSTLMSNSKCKYIEITREKMNKKKLKRFNLHNEEISLFQKKEQGMWADRGMGRVWTVRATIAERLIKLFHLIYN